MSARRMNSQLQRARRANLKTKTSVSHISARQSFRMISYANLKMTGAITDWVARFHNPTLTDVIFVRSTHNIYRISQPGDSQINF